MPKTVSDYTALLSGTSWWGDKTVDKPVFVTYSFEYEAYDYLSDFGFSDAFTDSFARLSNFEETAASFAIAHWASSSGITFLEVPAGQGDIRFGRYDLGKNPNVSDAAAFAYYPATAIDRSGSYSLAYGGDVFVDLSVENYSFYGMIHVLTHEIGHAIGLKHPFEGDIRLDPALDTVAHTIMSYDDVPSTIPKLGELDEAAVAYLYGSEKADGTQVSSWNWDAKTYTLTQTGGSKGETIRGVSTSDVIQGGAGDDLVFSGTGDDRIDGGANDDVVFADAGDDTASGGLGDDVLYGGIGKDALSGETGNDALVGDDGDDVLKGGDGDDALFGFTGKDRLEGGTGDDVLVGGAGDDALDGGSGGESAGDTADYGAARQQIRLDLNGMRENVGGKVVVLHASGVEIGRDTLANVENVVGGSGSDLLTGNAAANRFWGGAGNDLLTGNAGADRLEGGDGRDQLEGGAGSDILVGGTSNDRLIGGGDDDQLIAGDGNDTLVGDSGADRLDGGLGDDVLSGGGGDDRLNGGTGGETMGDRADYGRVREAIVVDLNGMSDATYTLVHAVGAEIGRDRLERIEHVTGGAGSDSLSGNGAANQFWGGRGNDILDGRKGDDFLWGGAGHDQLSGGHGSDTLDGQDGDDRLAGGTGTDTLTGGAGADRFVFDTRPGADNADRITDFAAGTDRLWLDADVFTALKAGPLAEGQFHAGRAAHDADDRLIFDARSKSLFYDADGTGAGAQVRIATLDKVAALAASDFLIVV